MGTKKYIITSDSSPITINVTDHQINKINNKKISPEINRISGEDYKIKLKNRTFKGEVTRLKQNACTVVLNGNTYTFTIETENSFKRTQKLAKTIKNVNLKLTAPLPGTICEISVEKNQKISKGEALLTLEAMKMQNEIISPVDGTITNIYIKESDSVLKDQMLIEIEPQ